MSSAGPKRTPMKRLRCDADAARIKQTVLDGRKIRRDLLKEVQSSMNLKRRPRKNIPGAGRPAQFEAIEKELASLVRENKKCPFLHGPAALANSGDNTFFFMWDTPALAASMQRRCAA